MIDRKQIQLIQSLCDRSEQRKITWEKTAEPKDFMATIGDYLVAISEVESSQIYNAKAYEILIFGVGGDVVEKISSEMSVDPEVADDEPSVFPLMRQIHELARRQAHGADQAIDDLLQQLNSVG